MPSKKEPSFFDSLIAEITTSIRSTEKMSIVDFANDIIFNGEGDKLYPTQCAILKAYYKEPLTEEEERILEEWSKENRTTWVKDRHYIALILEAGRRGSKCNAENSIIPTTVGDITYKELYERHTAGEHIGILTVDMDADVKQTFITYDIKIEPNAYEEVYEIKTESGRTEIVNKNHPIPIWKHDCSNFQWITIEEFLNTDFKKVPRIAISSELNIWGNDELSDKELSTCISNVKKDKPFPKKVNTLTRESSLKLLSELCLTYGAVKYERLRYKVIEGNEYEDRQKNYVIDINKKNNKFLHRLLCKFGCHPIYYLDNVVINSLQGALRLSELIKLKYSDFERINSFVREFDKGYTENVPNDFYGDEKFKEEITAFRYDCVNSLDVNWDYLKQSKVRKIGKKRTYAVEVAKTHVIASYIITHNSTMASIIALKEFYDLITLENPQKTYNILTGSPIAILVMAQSQAQVKETIFAAIRGYAENSTYFKGLHDAGFINILTEEIRCPSKNIAIYAKHTNSKSLVGYTLKCMLLDEVARFETVGEEGKNKAFEIWRNVAAGGAQFGDSFRKIAISSAWEPGDPIEILYEDCHKDPLSLGFKLTTFQVNLALKKGVTPVIVSDYATDFIKARREYEGIRFSKFNTFIDLVNLERNMTGITTIDAQPCKLDVTSAAGTRHYAGVDILRIKELNDPEQLQFCHIDPALKKDSAALAMAHVERVKDNWKIVVDTLIKWEPHVDEDGLKRVVSFIDIERKLDYIHEHRKLYRVTFDQWNSESFIQKLHTKGIDSQIASCSRESQFSYYTLFRDLVAHDYIVLPRDTLWSNNAIIELSELVLKPNRQIIHPYAGKDLADAIVNVVYQVHQYMVRAGLNIMMGLSPMIAKSDTLERINSASTNVNRLNIGSARDKLYKERRF